MIPELEMELERARTDKKELAMKNERLRQEL